MYVITSTVSPIGGPPVVWDVSGTTVATPTGCRTIAPSSVCTVAPLTTPPTLSDPLSGSERNTPPWSSVQLPPYLQHSNGQTPRPAAARQRPRAAAAAPTRAPWYPRQSPRSDARQAAPLRAWTLPRIP